MRYSLTILNWFAIAIAFITGMSTVVSANAMVQPTQYVMSGKNLEISYQTGDLNAEPVFKYSRSGRDFSFSGDQIRVTQTEIGQLVTVTLRQVPDLKTVTLTLLLPAINLISDTALFETFVIYTTHKTTIQGPDVLDGQIQSYSTQRVRGKASHGQINDANLSGVVTISPTCPGPISPDQNCVEPYVGARVQVLDGFNNILQSTITNEKGMFDVYMPPGEYVIHIARISVIPIPVPLPEPIPVDPVPLPIELDKLSVLPGTNISDISELSLFPICQDKKVVVPEQGSVFVRINCDTGIR